MSSNGGLLQRLNREYEWFKRDAPGKRFQALYKRRRDERRGRAGTVLVVLAGVVLIVAGFLLGLIPGVPGIVLGFLGAALIATRFRRMALWMDWAEVRTRRAWRRFRPT